MGVVSKEPNEMKANTPMNRRSFLAKAGAASTLLALQPRRAWGAKPPVDEKVEKVLVIFKTHLDIGYTDLAANVLKTYFEHFIPGVLSLTEQIDREHREDRYIWTTGSWLIYRYLEEASPENRRRMEQAIQSGAFVWHGLPFSTHSELLDRSLFSLGIAFAARLDARFGRKTLAGKITDVPGHTRGLVPVMAEAGLELLHIGANTGAAELEVPPVFRWRSPDGAELTVMYQHDYGAVTVLPGGKVAVAINFTSDNQGPHKPEQIAKIYAGLRRKFPTAQVFASNLNALALELRALRTQLPVLTQELGDTWIYGTGSAPLMMAHFRELSRLRQEWIASGRLVAHGDVDLAVGKHLLCVPEHTWGTSRTNERPDLYEMAAFRASRNLKEFKFMEQSWAEKRANLDTAISQLPADLAAEANQRIKALRPARIVMQGLAQPADPGVIQDAKHFRIGFDGKTGAIRYLEHRASSRNWAAPAHELGLFTYQTFSSADFDRFMDQYVMPKERTKTWCLHGWGRLGLDKTGARSALYSTHLKQLSHRRLPAGDLFLAELAMPDTGDSGCPHEMVLEAFLPDDEPVVKLTLKWFNKPASRLPEAVWFSFQPPISTDGRLTMDKMGQAVSPLAVVKGGNRNMHGVIKGVSYKDQHSAFQLDTLDAFLFAPGRRSLLLFDNAQPELANGLHFCLFNNVYSTNFHMWCEDDMQFRFNLSFQNEAAV
jgi:hypothetical protein